MSKICYNAGDKIFAKVKGYPHWPARINLLPAEVLVPKGKYPIFFYGTHEVYFLTPKDIFPYEKYKSKYGKELPSRPQFNQGLIEIEYNENVLVYGKDYKAEAFLSQFYKFTRTDNGESYKAIIKQEAKNVTSGVDKQIVKKVLPNLATGGDSKNRSIASIDSNSTSNLSHCPPATKKPKLNDVLAKTTPTTNYKLHTHRNSNNNSELVDTDDSDYVTSDSVLKIATGKVVSSSLGKRRPVAGRRINKAEKSAAFPKNRRVFLTVNHHNSKLLDNDDDSLSSLSSTKSDDDNNNIDQLKNSDATSDNDSDKDDQATPLQKWKMTEDAKKREIEAKVTEFQRLKAMEERGKVGSMIPTPSLTAGKLLLNTSMKNDQNKLHSPAAQDLAGGSINKRRSSGRTCAQKFDVKKLLNMKDEPAVSPDSATGNKISSVSRKIDFPGTMDNKQETKTTSLRDLVEGKFFDDLKYIPVEQRIHEQRIEKVVNKGKIKQQKSTEMVKERSSRRLIRSNDFSDDEKVDSKSRKSSFSSEDTNANVSDEETSVKLSSRNHKMIGQQSLKKSNSNMLQLSLSDVNDDDNISEDEVHYRVKKPTENQHYHNHNRTNKDIRTPSKATNITHDNVKSITDNTEEPSLSRIPEQQRGYQAEAILTVTNVQIKASLIIGRENFDNCCRLMECLLRMVDRGEISLATLAKQSDLVSTIRKCRKYRLSPDVRQLAQKVHTRFCDLFSQASHQELIDAEIEHLRARDYSNSAYLTNNNNNINTYNNVSNIIMSANNSLADMFRTTVINNTHNPLIETQTKQNSEIVKRVSSDKVELNNIHMNYTPIPERQNEGICSTKSIITDSVLSLAVASTEDVIPLTKTSGVVPQCDFRSSDNYSVQSESQVVNSNCWADPLDSIPGFELAKSSLGLGVPTSNPNDVEPQEEFSGLGDVNNEQRDTLEGGDLLGGLEFVVLDSYGDSDDDECMDLDEPAEEEAPTISLFPTFPMDLESRIQSLIQSNPSPVKQLDHHNTISSQHKHNTTSSTYSCHSNNVKSSAIDALLYLAPPPLPSTNITLLNSIDPVAGIDTSLQQPDIRTKTISPLSCTLTSQRCGENDCYQPLFTTVSCCSSDVNNVKDNIYDSNHHCHLSFDTTSLFNTDDKHKGMIVCKDEVQQDSVIVNDDELHNLLGV